MDNFILIGTESQIEKAEKTRTSLLKGIDNYVKALKDANVDIGQFDNVILNHIAFKCKEIISEMSYAEDILKTKFEDFTNNDFSYVIYYSKGLTELYFNYMQFGKYRRSQKEFLQQENCLWNLFWSTYHVSDISKNTYHITSVREQIEEYNQWATLHGITPRKLNSQDKLELDVYDLLVEKGIANKVYSDDMYFILKCRQSFTIRDFTEEEIRFLKNVYHVDDILNSNSVTVMEDLQERIYLKISEREAPEEKPKKKKRS